MAVKFGHKEYNRNTEALPEGLIRREQIISSKSEQAETLGDSHYRDVSSVVTLQWWFYHSLTQLGLANFYTQAKNKINCCTSVKTFCAESSPPIMTDCHVVFKHAVHPARTLATKLTW